MTHYYELRRFEDNGTMTIVQKFSMEPKFAKQEAKEYAKRNPGLYGLYKIETVANYFSEKEN